MFSALFVLALITTSVSADDAFQWKTDKALGTSDLIHNGKPVIRYMFAFDDSSKEKIHDTYKVFHHVFGPKSGKQITKGAGGKYTHHRGMFVGWNKTSFGDGKRYDFWHCKNGAHLRHIRFLSQTADEKGGSMTSEIHWNDPDGKPVIREIRTVTVTPQAGLTGYHINWSSTLESQVGEITLDGDRQHAGFQFRAAQAVADANGARFLRPSSFPQKREAIQVGDKGNPPAHIDLGWFAETYELDGSTYTIEYFDNPNLPKPALFSERPYGRFGTFFKTTIDEGKPLKLQYRLIVSEGDVPEVDDIQKRYEEFVAGL